MKRLRTPLRTRVGFDNLQHAVLAGAPGSGKTTAHQIALAPEVGKRFILDQTPHNSPNDPVLAEHVRRHEGLIEVIDCDAPRYAVGFSLCRLSDHPDELQRRLDDNNAVEQVMTFLGSERGINFNAMPLLGLWVRYAHYLWARQRTRKPYWLVPYALKCHHPTQLTMLADCWDEDLVREFRILNAMTNYFQRENLVSPAKRLLAVFFENVFIDTMLRKAAVSWLEWMRLKKLVLVRASTNTPQAVYRTLMGLLRVLTVQEAMRHYAETGEPLPATIWVDEAARMKIGTAEADLMAQCRKAGVGYKLIYQSLPKTDEFKDIAATIARWEIYPNASADAAETVAKELMALQWDAAEVKRREVRERQVHRGSRVEEVSTRTQQLNKLGTKTGETTGTHFLTTPEYDTVFDEHVTTMSVQDKIATLTREVRTLVLGERIVIEHGKVTRERFQKPEESWSESSKREHVAGALERIRSRPHYARAAEAPPVSPVEQPAEPPASAPGSRLAGRRRRRG